MLAVQPGEGFFPGRSFLRDCVHTFPAIRSSLLHERHLVSPVIPLLELILFDEVKLPTTLAKPCS